MKNKINNLFRVFPLLKKDLPRFSASTQKGFTLIELLVVISIIGILSGIFLNKIGDFRARAEDARRVADLRHVQTLLELFYDKCSSYPFENIAIDDEGKCSGNPPSSGAKMTWDNLRGTLVEGKIGIKTIAGIPQDPNTGGAEGRTYEYASNGTGYVLMARLKEKNPLIDQSPKGTIMGVDCDTRNDATQNYHYCIEF